MVSQGSACIFTSSSAVSNQLLQRRTPVGPIPEGFIPTVCNILTVRLILQRGDDSVEIATLFMLSYGHLVVWIKQETIKVINPLEH